MSDFPSAQLPLFVSTYSLYSGLQTLARLVSMTAAAVTWTANQAVYIPVSLPWPYPVARVFWANGSTVTTTNCDFGIYSPFGTRIYSTGSTTQVGASTLQYVTPTTPFTLPAGRYFFAWVCDNTTSRAFGILPNVNLAATAGLLTQATALPLPATATFARFSNIGPVICGITRTAVGTAF